MWVEDDQEWVRVGGLEVLPCCVSIQVGVVVMALVNVERVDLWGVVVCTRVVRDVGKAAEGGERCDMAEVVN